MRQSGCQFQLTRNIKVYLGLPKKNALAHTVAQGIVSATSGFDVVEFAFYM